MDDGDFEPASSEVHKRYRPWITDGWFKSLWEKVDRFGIIVEVCNIPLLQQRKRDKWMMMELNPKGHSTEDLRRLNRVRVQQKLLLLSDVMGASGKSLDKNYLKQRGKGEQWSTCWFP